MKFNAVDDNREQFVVSITLPTNNNVHLSCAHQRPGRSHDTY